MSLPASIESLVSSLDGYNNVMKDKEINSLSERLRWKWSCWMLKWLFFNMLFYVAMKNAIELTTSGNVIDPKELADSEGCFVSLLGVYVCL